LVDALRKRLPPHRRDRLLERLLPLRPYERLALPGVALTVICDDGAAKGLAVLEVLELRGMKGVIAVSPATIGLPGYLSYEQLRRVRATGHEIAFHGTSDLPFPDFDGAESLRSSLARGLEQLDSEGLGRPRTLVYPAGRNTAWVRRVAADLFTCAFTTWHGDNRTRANRFAIRRVALGAFTPKNLTESSYRHLIDRPAAHGWPALMLHPGEADHQSAHNELLGRLLDHAVEHRVAVRTASAHLAASGAPAANGHGRNH
jgi:peptidoglycan/xylan/chitin deacetylase (PgdA/CDA1 family)